MQAQLTRDNGSAVIKLSGRFDFNAHREFRSVIEDLMSKPVRDVKIDMAGVDYLDSSALGMLLMLRDKAKGASAEVALTNCAGAVKQVLEIANFSKLFRVL